MWSRWKNTAIEWLSVIVSGIAVLLAIVFGAASMKAASDANTRAAEADIRTELYAQSYKELEREYRLLQLEIDDFRIAIIKAGIELEHEEKP